MITVNEEWKGIEGWEHLYQVSTLGNIYSIRTGKILKPITCRGYTRVTVADKDVRISKQIHRLVAQAFIPNPKNKPYVNHIDGDKTNNTVSNLEWVTSQENTLHAFKTHLMASGEAHKQAKLTYADVQAIRLSYSQHLYTMRELALMYNVSKMRISQIINNKAWRW